MHSMTGSFARDEENKGRAGNFPLVVSSSPATLSPRFGSTPVAGSACGSSGGSYGRRYRETFLRHSPAARRRGVAVHRGGSAFAS